jgi:hypothetical protein
MTTKNEKDDQMMVDEPAPAKTSQGDFDKAQIICIIGMLCLRGCIWVA